MTEGKQMAERIRRWKVYGDRITRSGPAGHGGADDDHRCSTAELLAESINADYDALEQRVAEAEREREEALASRNRMVAKKITAAVKEAEELQAARDAAEITLTNANARADDLQAQLTAVVQERDSATRNLQLLISENLNERIPALEAAEAKAQRYREALERIATHCNSKLEDGSSNPDWAWDHIAVAAFARAALADAAETGA